MRCPGRMIEPLNTGSAILWSQDFSIRLRLAISSLDPGGCRSLTSGLLNATTNMPAADGSERWPGISVVSLEQSRRGSSSPRRSFFLDLIRIEIAKCESGEFDPDVEAATLARGPRGE